MGVVSKFIFEERVRDDNLGAGTFTSKTSAWQISDALLPVKATFTGE
jgi:hypothetical protein